MLNQDLRKISKFTDSGDESIARLLQRKSGWTTPLDSEFKTVKVLPFIGKDYGKPNRLGIQLLVLGESHYNPNGGPLHRNFTREVLRNHGDGFAFFTKVVGSFYGKRPSREMKGQFWRTVVFYNFIQESVGRGPKDRPTDNMWKQAPPAFDEVLRRCRPGFVLILGQQLWDNLGIPLAEGPTIRLANGRSEPSRLYENDTFLFGINHPAAFGWTYDKWTPWIHAALAEAVRLKPKV